MAKKKSKKRGWSGAPPARPSGGPRPSGTATSRPTAQVTQVTTEEREPATPPSPAASPAPSPARPARTPTKARTVTAPPAAQPASNRTARKEEARRHREMLRRKDARRRAVRRYGTIAGIVVAVGVVGTLIYLGSRPFDFSKIDPTKLPGITREKAPWPAETADLSQRIAKMHLPPLGGEQLAYHIHQDLAVYVNGTQEPVPTGLGSLSANSLAEIHTHTGSGTIHVEAGATRRFTLGTIFDVWGVLFTRDKDGAYQLGAYKDDGDKRVRVYMNGKLYRDDATQLPLGNEQVIVVTYGTPDQVPDPMPSVFHYESPPTAPKSTPAPSSSASESSQPSAAPSASAS
jgi:hypothetical protein